MHEEGSRCGIVTRGRFGRRASTVASLALLGLLVSALPASGSQAPAAVAGSVCSMNLPLDSSLVARFSPLEVRVIRGGNGTGGIVSEPAGIACPPTCTAPFPAGVIAAVQLTIKGYRGKRLPLRWYALDLGTHDIVDEQRKKYTFEPDRNEGSRAVHDRVRDLSPECEARQAWCRPVREA